MQSRATNCVHPRYIAVCLFQFAVNTEMRLACSVATPYKQNEAMFACRDAETGYMQDDTATFTAAFHVIKETCTFSRSLERIGSKARTVKSKSVSTGENFQGKFVWKIEHFTRLKDILKKRKITGLCVKSKRFTVGGRDCRLIVYPRGTLSKCQHHRLCILIDSACLFASLPSMVHCTPATLVSAASQLVAMLLQPQQPWA